MSSVQQHGFTWENELIQNVFGATKEELKAAKQHYTSKMDLPATLNRVNGSDLSIKTTGAKNTVCMADCLRIFDAVSHTTAAAPYHMVVVSYEQEGNHKKLVSVTEVDLTDSKEALFGSLTREQIVALDTAIKRIPQKRKPTDQEHADIYALRDELQKHSGAIQLNIKCNSQQSRLQCSFNRWTTFLSEFPDRIVAASATGEIHGKKITETILSGRRQFGSK
uniref:Uncharacterized protein n=1 Tax=viral metagenome TaxID=1070528 RepID=A0A6C0I665_9ZZZZ